MMKMAKKEEWKELTDIRVSYLGGDVQKCSIIYQKRFLRKYFLPHFPQIDSSNQLLFELLFCLFEISKVVVNFSIHLSSPNCPPSKLKGKKELNMAFWASFLKQWCFPPPPKRKYKIWFKQFFFRRNVIWQNSDYF